MVEGGSSADFERIKLLFYTDRAMFEALGSSAAAPSGLEARP